MANKKLTRSEALEKIENFIKEEKSLDSFEYTLLVASREDGRYLYRLGTSFQDSHPMDKFIKGTFEDAVARFLGTYASPEKP